MSKPHIRRAEPDDIPAVMQLESRYYVGNLPPADRGYGYISILHTAEWFRWAIDNEGLQVAVNSRGEILGFMCVTPPPDPAAEVSPVIGAMLELAGQLTWDGTPIAQLRYAFRGPTLIDSAGRGRGIYDSFTVICHDFYSERYNLLILFVAADNPRSLKAATTKLGATKLTDFQVDGKKYHFLALELSGDKARD